MSYKRSIFLINPKFQVKFALLVSLIIFVASLVYPMALYEMFDLFLGLNIAPTSAEKIKEARFALLVWLGIYQIVFTVIAFVTCIILAHRVAGPMFKLQRTLRSISDGNPPETISFRKGDNFPEIAHEYNNAIQYLKHQHEADMASLEEVRILLSNLAPLLPDDKRPIIEQVNHRIAQIKSKFQSPS